MEDVGLVLSDFQWIYSIGVKPGLSLFSLSSSHKGKLSPRCNLANVRWSTCNSQTIKIKQEHQSSRPAFAHSDTIQPTAYKHITYVHSAFASTSIIFSCVLLKAASGLEIDHAGKAEKEKNRKPEERKLSVWRDGETDRLSDRQADRHIICGLKGGECH